MGHGRQGAERRLVERRGRAASVRVNAADDACLTIVAPDAPVEDLGVAVTDAIRRLSQAEDSVLAAGLSPREREVACLVAAGYSNGQIATSLVIGEDTAKKHVSHALAKLGLHNRTELALVAAQLSYVLDRSL